MKLATIRTAEGTAAARIEGERAVVLDYPDLTTLLAHSDWRQQAVAEGKRSMSLAETGFAALVAPVKVLCVGLNYRTHILEMGRELPTYPTLFGKYADTLTGAHDDIPLPVSSQQVDWEVELGVVIGATARQVSEAEAAACIAGYTVVNDISMRDWQWRTTQWLPGKNFEASTPVGPVLVTPEEVDHARDLQVSCEVDGQVMQSAHTSDLLFTPAAVLSYISQFTALRPGDLIATGTPGGVGAGRDPKVFLRPGQTIRSTMEGIGSCVNPCVENKQ